ncbi:glycoprotein-N-acetylgalactosamine 3-beta-galactosyltransferase 1-like [Schistocerca cancellata]|uniref:glycoprotein-N-acetylgalactosamine 3-beta-galactosyltransferase 1-like n=1 Tax=Schistocerca cancellata TaxID=274614 RepID=UPI0021199A9B|nr:glycoprotein-N-acetylgalactosamine 3-beta-galactosyltransferase 1-like [Schistocerca cancellata]
MSSICSYKNIVFLIGFLIGMNIAFSLIKMEEDYTINSFSLSLTVIHPYKNWFSKKFLSRFSIDYDEISYGKETKVSEAEYLNKEVSIICAVFMKKVQNAKALQDTWGKKCNRLIFFSTREFNDFPVVQFKPKNSWHFLCDCIRHIWKNYGNQMQWVLFVPDDMFVIPENLRYYVAPLDYRNPHYLGHALTFWGQLYNIGQAGYVVSKGALSALESRFNTTEKCAMGGKYWKNEDFYLGKHLGELGITPEDTRDSLGRGRFHGYSFNQLLFRGKISTLGSYWKRSVFPVHEGRECCSDLSITFHGIEADKIYLYDYLLNHLRVFRHGGHRGNMPPVLSTPEEEVWKSFLRKEGHPVENVSAEEYFRLWQDKVSAPDDFNKRIRSEQMSHFFEGLLSAAQGNDSVNE